MKSTVGTNHIICCSCGLRFERTKEFRHCSNCFACTGCEICYCPQCDNEIIITSKISNLSDAPVIILPGKQKIFMIIFDLHAGTFMISII